MKIIEVFKKDAWNNFIFSQVKRPGSEFLQSWEWGAFQKKLGRKVWYFGIKNESQMIAQALVVKHNLPLCKSYFYCPRGPIIPASGDSKSKILELLIKEIKEIAKGENAIFWRMEPLNKDVLSKVYPVKSFTESKRKSLILFNRVNSLKFRVVAVRPVQPSKTLILDFKKSEPDLLSQMHSKTRYNIRLAQKHGVKVFKSNEEKYLNIFLNLLHQTSEREKIKSYPDNYYKKLLNSESKSACAGRFASLYLAEYQNRILAAHLLIFFNHTATYVHGASSREHKEVMAPYLLHWHTIQQAKKENIYFYDFWGIDKKKWPGLTRFKTGFNGEKIVYPGTFDIPLSKIWYYLYKLGKLCSLLF